MREKCVFFMKGDVYLCLCEIPSKPQGPKMYLTQLLIFLYKKDKIVKSLKNCGSSRPRNTGFK